MSDPIFTNWTPDLTAKWANAPLLAKHRLHTHPLFQLDALGELIKGYPRDQYSLVEVGEKGSPRRLWREGDIGSLSGHHVIEAISNGRMWLNLRDIGKTSQTYGAVLDAVFEEIRDNVGGYETYNRTSGILISSPNAQVYYHCDLPGQSLWQLAGKKRVFVYPNKPPFVTPQQLENIALTALEVGMTYDPAYDQHAEVFDIEGGEMLHWPLNAPHRVENFDCLNVSMTTEYWTEAIRRNQMINTANGILRQHAKLNPQSRAISGAGFWAKAAMQAGVRRTGVLEKTRKSVRPIEFVLDHKNLGRVVDIPHAAE
jgi:hypothetical protein